MHSICLISKYQGVETDHTKMHFYLPCMRVGNIFVVSAHSSLCLYVRLCVCLTAVSVEAKPFE